jgi:RNA polymerase sigma-70 factor, ECF subfamily
MLSISYNFGATVTHEPKASVHTIAAREANTIAIPTNRIVDLTQEKQLVEAAKKNAENFGRLYDFYFPKVYAFVAAKVRDRDDAEDITGDIFMKVLENLPRYEWRGLPFGAWVFRIARNTLNDYYEKSAKTRTTDIDTAYGVSEDEEKTSPHKKAAKEELAGRVKEILADLPERELNVIQLKFFSEMNNREIMHITGLSESNVAVIIYRTLRKIKPDLKYFA